MNVSNYFKNPVIGGYRGGFAYVNALKLKMVTTYNKYANVYAYYGGVYFI
jgi:hypothetical protein